MALRRANWASGELGEVRGDDGGALWHLDAPFLQLAVLILKRIPDRRHAPQIRSAISRQCEPAVAHLDQAALGQRLQGLGANADRSALRTVKQNVPAS